MGYISTIDFLLLTYETSDRATIDNAVFIEAGTRASKTSDIIKVNE